MSQYRCGIGAASTRLPAGCVLDRLPRRILSGVRRAAGYCSDIEFSPEDGSRSEVDFLCRVLEAVIKEGARTINIADTVGYGVPQQFGEFIRKDIARWTAVAKAAEEDVDTFILKPFTPDSFRTAGVSVQLISEIADAPLKFACADLTITEFRS